MNQIFTPFCKLCRTEGHTVMYSPRKQNQSNFQSQNFYRPDQNLFGDYSNRTFRPFQRNQNQFHHRHFRILDHNKTLPKLGIVSLETKMVPERKLNIGSATISKTHVDKITQGLTKIIQFKIIINTLLSKMQIMKQIKTNHQMFSIQMSKM